MTKAELRLRFIAQLRTWTMSRETHRAASDAICAHIIQHAAWRQAKLACAFLPLPSEPRLAPLWSEGPAAALCFPRVRGAGVELIRIDDREQLPGADWKLAGAEFDSAPVVAPESVDLFLVPGLAFTADGRRLGRGGGYYDRLLPQRSPQSCALGICFDVQLTRDLPVEPHDQMVDGVITESGLAARFRGIL